MRIKGTRLHRSVMRCTTVDKRRLVRELGKALRAVPRLKHRVRSASPLDRAFAWSDSPQGGPYWADIFVECRA